GHLGSPPEPASAFGLGQASVDAELAAGEAQGAEWFAVSVGERPEPAAYHSPQRPAPCSGYQCGRSTRSRLPARSPSSRGPRMSLHLAFSPRARSRDEAPEIWGRLVDAGTAACARRWRTRR